MIPAAVVRPAITRAAETAVERISLRRASKASNAAASARTTGIPAQKTMIVTRAEDGKDERALRARSSIRGTITQKTIAVAEMERTISH
jgi:hypothetical protein